MDIYLKFLTYSFTNSLWWFGLNILLIAVLVLILVFMVIGIIEIYNKIYFMFWSKKKVRNVYNDSLIERKKTVSQ